VITGRGPGAPGMTPGLEFTRRRAGEAAPGTVAADLGEIRRAETAIDLVAQRAAAAPGLLDDPALALLTALAADVDAPGTSVRQHAGVWVGRRVPSRGLAAWLRAAVAGVVVAGLAGTTSLVAASMLARLTRGAGGRGRRLDRGWAARPARPRRLR
jgi:hypothetical protein